MTDIIERLEQVQGDNEDAREAADEIRRLFAENERLNRINSDQTHEIDHWRTENDNGVSLIAHLSAEIDNFQVEIAKLKDQIDTCRELRKYDRIEVERLRLLMDKR